MTIKLDGKLPPEIDRNGLDVIHAKLMAEPHQLQAVIMLVDRKSFEHKDDDEEDIPKARVRAVEAITPEDLRVARQLMDRSREKRLGRVQLPFGMEDEVRSAFAAVSGATVQQRPDGTRVTTIDIDPSKLAEPRGVWITAQSDGTCAGEDCPEKITPGDRIQSDGDGGWLCNDCSTGDDGGEDE